MYRSNHQPTNGVDMAKAKYDIAPQLVVAEQRRQRYLDYFKANPGKTTPELLQYMTDKFGETTATCNTIRRMVDLGELNCKKTGRVFQYYATTTKTISAEAFSAQQREAARKNMCERNGVQYVEKEKPSDSIKAGDNLGCARYVHKPTHTHQSGGQGNVRQRVFVGCSAMCDGI